MELQNGILSMQFCLLLGYDQSIKSTLDEMIVIRGKWKWDVAHNNY